MMNIELNDASATEATETTDGCGCGCGCGCGEVATEAPAGAVQATYTVTGMTCGHCVKAVTEEVSAIDGVTGVDVDLATGRLVVSSGAPVDFDRIVEAVAEAGDYAIA